MYIEDKSGGLVGQCRIGRVHFSNTGATLTYAGRSFQSLKGVGFKANYFDVESGDYFWISGPRRDGADGLYGRITESRDVDDDVAEEYWRKIRKIDSPKRLNVRAALVVTTNSDSPSSSIPVNAGRKHSRVAQLVRSGLGQAK